MATDKEITIEIKTPELLLLIPILIIFMSFELIVTLNSPIAFGDEAFHVRKSQYIAENKDYPVWNPFIGHNDEKIGFSGALYWHLLQAGFYLIFGFHEFIVKFITPFISTFLLGLIIFLLGKKIYNREIGFIASIIAVTIPSLVTYSVLFYVDAIFLLYLTLFLFTLILSIKSNQKKYIILSAIFGTLSLLTKMPGFVIFPALLFSFLYEFFIQKNFFPLLKKYSIFIFIFILMFGPLSIREMVYFNTPYCSLPIFDSSGCAKSSSYENQYQFSGITEQVGTEVDIFRMGLMNYLNFAYGIIWFVPLFFFCGLSIFFKRLEKSDILILLSFIAFLPVIYLSIFGRAENTARYLLGLIPPITLIAGNYLFALYSFIKKYLKQIALVIFIFVIVLSFMNLNDKLYAARHYDSGSGGYVGYKIFSPRLIEACDWVKKNLDEDILIGDIIWGYATAYNCQRNVGGGGPDVRLSNNLTLALSVLENQGITHLFITKFSISWNDQKLAERYPISYLRFLEDNPKNFIKVYENGPTLQQCQQMGGCDGVIVYEVDYNT